MADSVKYTFNEHLIRQQWAAEQAMLEELEQGDYTFEHPLVKVNPYLISPLSAVILFKTEEETAITLTVLGKTPAGDIRHTFPPDKTHVLPVLGLYSGRQNTVELRKRFGGASTLTIQTPDVFEGKKPPVYAMCTTPEYLQDDLIFLVTADLGFETVRGVDSAGDVRWCLNVYCNFEMKKLQNGNVLIGSNRVIKSPYYMSGLYEMSLTGKIYKEYRVPGAYHHDHVEMPDGNLLVLSDNFDSETVEDVLVLVDRQTGDVRKTWDFNDFLQSGLGKSGSWSEEDWFHSNAVWYDEKTHTITISGRHMDSLCNIDFDTGKLNWIIGDPEGWPEEWAAKYFFKPVGEPFDWQYEQHGCLLTPEGDVMCFDNGHFRAKHKDAYRRNRDNFSRGVRFAIDTDKKEIRQVWQYGKERGSGFFSTYISNVEYYGENHYLVHSGGIAYLDGEPSDQLGSLVRAFGTGRLELRSTTVLVYGDRVLLEMQTPGNFYRAKKMKLYHEGENLALGEGALLGGLGVTREYAETLPQAAAGGPLPEDHGAAITEEEDRFVFTAKFRKGQVPVLLLAGETTHQYRVNTLIESHLAHMYNTLAPEVRPTATNVNKEGLHGTFDIRLQLEGTLYETGIQITCE